MGTLVCFHAHPDDEAISTGGSIARAAAEGHRVVLVVATNGAHGETPDDLGPGESLVDRRRTETEQSAAILGAHRLVWLGYEDSGMTGWDQNDHEDSFHQAPLDEAAARLAAVLREEAADVLTVYDWHGNYGHPDHIKVHHVGHRAAEMAGTPAVFEATINRDHLRRLVQAAREAGLMGRDDGEGGDDAVDEDDFDIDGPADDGNPMGTPEAELTHAVDVRAFLQQKRASIAAHRSQITDTSFFLQMPDEMFAESFGTEWFIRTGTPVGMRAGWLFEDQG
jgi:LmbE family N-acetylglucosaminyl deacetylase